MKIANPRPPLARSVGTVLIATLLTGCMYWEPAPLTPQVLDDSARTGVRVTLIDGTRVKVREPYVFSDSLIGARYRYGGGFWTVAIVAYPLKDIAMIEILEMDGNATASVVVGGIFAIAGLLTALPNSPPTGQELFSAGRLQADRRDP